MKKLLCLFLATSFLTVAAPAFEGEGNYVIGTDEFTAPILEESSDATIETDADATRRYRCPRGYSRVPSYRWNYRRHRWEFAGYNCRRDRRRHDDRRGRDHRDDRHRGDDRHGDRDDDRRGDDGDRGRRY